VAARLIERAVDRRVRWLDLAYGDQALFVRHDVFDAMGGYREWPLMEDVEFVRRLRRAGKLYHSPQTGAHLGAAMERDGWWRRSASNVMLQALFFAGVRRSGWRTGMASTAPIHTRGARRHGTRPVRQAR